MPFMILCSWCLSAQRIIIGKIGNVKLTIFGGVISATGAFGLRGVQSSELEVSIRLAILQWDCH